MAKIQNMKNQAALVGSGYVLLFWISVKYLTPVQLTSSLLISEVGIILFM